MPILIAGWGLFIVFGVMALRSSGDEGPEGLAERARPTLLALALALLAWPVVALSLGATTGDARERIPATELSRWTAAASAVFISALVAGPIGGFAVCRHAKSGAVFTFLLALMVAIPALPLIPSALGQNVGAGFVCIDTCSDATSTSNLVAGVWADMFLLFAPLYEPVPVLTLVGGVVLWTVLLRRKQTADETTT
ncbi:MAG TPA: hypothetical protein VF337_03515 [Candidatus Limnocylindrales bacterium]